MTVEFLFWEIRWHLIPWEQMTLTKEQLIILSCKKKGGGGLGREKKYERECGSTLCEVSINESLTKAVLQLNFAWCPCDWVTIFKSNPSHKIKTTFRVGVQCRDVSSGNIVSLSPNLHYAKNKMQKNSDANQKCLSQLCSSRLQWYHSMSSPNGSSFPSLLLQ